MRASHHRYGPCLTEVTYSGVIGENIRHSETVSLARTDDIGCGELFESDSMLIKRNLFRGSRFFKSEPIPITFTREPKFALGNADGLTKEWSTIPGGDTYRTKPMTASGETPWVSMHEAVRRANTKTTGAWANRGIVIRQWNARLGGKSVPPHFAERGTTRHRSDYSIIDLVPPAGLSRLEPRDFIEATLEYLVMPQSADDYYGPNKELRSALQADGNTWRMVQREVNRNHRNVTIREGKLVHRFPDIRVHANSDRAAFDVAGGLGYVPITITGLGSHSGYTLMVDGKPLDQSVHGNDFWQIDFDVSTRRWSRTFNVPLAGKSSHYIQLSKNP